MNYPDVVAGHSLGEFSAVINGTISFEDGLNLVLNRALISQKVCEAHETAKGAVIGFPDEYIGKRIQEISDESVNLYFANHNGPTSCNYRFKKGIRIACKTLKAEEQKSGSIKY